MKDVPGVFELLSKPRARGPGVTVREWMRSKCLCQKPPQLGRALCRTRNRLHKNTLQENAPREQSEFVLGQQYFNV